MSELEVIAVPVALEDAEAALRANAFTEQKYDDADRPIPGSERLRIHTFAAGGGMALGADWDLDEALQFARAADERNWVDGLAHHDLLIRSGDRVRLFAVPRPNPEEPFDDFTRGVLEGLTLYAWMKDGTNYVGTTGRTLREARRAVSTSAATPTSPTPTTLRSTDDASFRSRLRPDRVRHRDPHRLDADPMTGITFCLAGLATAVAACATALRARTLVDRGRASRNTAMVAHGRRLAQIAQPTAVAAIALCLAGIASSAW